MNVLDANRTELGYALESELARTSLHATDRDPDRRLAWVNSICSLFLLIGVMGSRPASIRIKPLPPAEVGSAAIVEPLPPPPQTASEQTSQAQSDQATPDTPQVVVVTPAAPSISFAVPTIGNLLVPRRSPKRRRWRPSNGWRPCRRSRWC